ncbi:MAG: hypothetical protein JOY99_08700 [Sphingomonadaceae bacterium]|nr:hypothetical protein [Sphingomonadaceae bacterium]
MNAKSAALGLGIFSIALGLTEIIGARRIAQALDAEGHEGVLKGFGAREIVAGLGLLQAPAHSSRMWNRVGGDGLDLAALGVLAVKSPRNGALWGAIAFVVAATIADVAVARALDAETGEALPLVA